MLCNYILWSFYTSVRIKVRPPDGLMLMYAISNQSIRTFILGSTILRCNLASRRSVCSLPRSREYAVMGTPHKYAICANRASSQIFVWHIVAAM